MDTISTIWYFVHDIVDGLPGAATSEEISHVQHMVRGINEITLRQPNKEDLAGMQGILHHTA
jgi:hypothetical protein